MDFISSAKAILENSGFKPLAPGELVDRWADLIEQCVEGYYWTLYEFDNEMTVRDYLDALLRDQSLKDFAEFKIFKLTVAELDRKYSALLQSNIQRSAKSNHWWRTGVLQYACREYCEDMSRRYSINVDVHGE